MNVELPKLLFGETHSPALMLAIRFKEILK
jgi:hypothetical protein